MLLNLFKRLLSFNQVDIFQYVLARLHCDLKFTRKVIRASEIAAISDMWMESAHIYGLAQWNISACDKGGDGELIWG